MRKMTFFKEKVQEFIYLNHSTLTTLSVVGVVLLCGGVSGIADSPVAGWDQDTGTFAGYAWALVNGVRFLAMFVGVLSLVTVALKLHQGDRGAGGEKNALLNVGIGIGLVAAAPDAIRFILGVMGISIGL